MDSFSDSRLLRRKRYAVRRRLLVCGIALSLILAITAAVLIVHLSHRSSAVDRLRDVEIPDWITQDLIRIGGPSRRGFALTDFNDVVIHYVGNPATTAQQNRNWFDNPQSQVSSHFVVGLDGEIIQCLPLYELSAASNQRNPDTISIEVCHPDDSGKFTDETYDAVVKLTAWLLDVGGLDDDRVIRHHDVTGKECPRYYVRNPDAWDMLRADIATYRNK